MPDKDDDEHHHNDDDKSMEFLYVVNSTEPLAKVSGLPVYSNFTVVVFLVDKNYDIYKSTEIITQTGEGGE